MQKPAQAYLVTDTVNGRKVDRRTTTTAVAHGLAELLKLTQSLCRQSLYTHWQTADPDAPGLHSLFEQHYQCLRKAADIISERIAGLGYDQPDSYAGSWGTHPDDNLPQKEMIERLVRSHGSCAHQARKLLVLADRAQDDVTANIALQRATMHEQAMWLLSALPHEKDDAIRSAG